MSDRALFIFMAVILLGFFGVAGYRIWVARHTTEKATIIQENQTNPAKTPTDMEKTQNITVTPIEHATAVIAVGDKTLYVDPVGGADAFTGQPAADVVLVTHNHSDHFNAETLQAVLGEATLIVPQAVKDQLPEALTAKATVMNNGDTLDVNGLTITAIPMYNIPESENAFHVKGQGNGYVVENNGARVYIAGDTSYIPEMSVLTDIDVALVPMNLPYTMGVEEAAQAVLDFKPKKVYPYHYRNQDGTLSDVERFKQLVGQGDPDIEVVLTDTWYDAPSQSAKTDQPGG